MPLRRDGTLKNAMSLTQHLIRRWWLYFLRAIKDPGVTNATNWEIAANMTGV